MNLETVLIVFIAAVAVILLVLLWSQKSTRAEIREIRSDQADNKAMTLMQQQIGQLTVNLTQQLQNMGQQFVRTTGHIGTTLGDVKKDMGRMQEVTREVLEKAKNISNLENLLRAPKFRGGLGELFLGDLLAQILPPGHYGLQHRFRSGEAVDAVIKLGGSLVPIDSKFPLENFKRFVSEGDGKVKDDLRRKFMVDIKRHVDEIAGKYILPDEGTYDFALMYIPAENIYYETILKDESFGQERSLYSYAIAKRVIPVSPNSFYAYLQVIVMGLKGLQIEKSAHVILRNLNRLHGDLERFKRDFQVLGTHLSNARTKFDEADKRLGRFSDKLDFVGGSDPSLLPEGEEPADD